MAPKEKTPLPPAGPTSTLGELLRRQGVTVRDEPAPAPATPVPTEAIVEGIKLPPSGLERIARDLRRALGCGASVEGGMIVVQGDMAARIAPWLQARGAPKVVVGN